MKKLWPALICLSACALSSCFGGGEAPDDGYVFYQSGMRFTSKGEALGYVVPEIDIDGETSRVKSVHSIDYCAEGDIYFCCEVWGKDDRYLCFCRAGDAVGKTLYRGDKYLYVSHSRNPYTKICRFSIGDGYPHFARDGEIVEIDDGELVCPEGDGRIIHSADARYYFYVEGDQRWELPRFWGPNIALNGWMVYCETTRGYISFDMRSKELVEVKGEYRWVMDRPFFVKKTEEEDVFCYLDDKGQVEERPLGVLLRRDPYRAGGDSIFRFGPTSASEYVYDYAFDKLTHCVEGKPSVYEGDFSYYEDDNYRFHVKMTYEPDGYTGPNYYRLNKKTGKDEFLYRRKSYNPTVRGDTTVFPEVGWVLAPTN